MKLTIYNTYKVKIRWGQTSNANKKIEMLNAVSVPPPTNVRQEHKMPTNYMHKINNHNKKKKKFTTI